MHTHACVDLLLHVSLSCQEHLLKFSEKGLRTLCLACRVLPPDFYQDRQANGCTSGQNTTSRHCCALWSCRERERERERGGAWLGAHKRGISAILARYPMKTRKTRAIPPSAIRSRKGIARYGGGDISHWATKFANNQPKATTI